MSAPRLKTNAELLAELAALPDGTSGEVIDGAAYVMGRPNLRHQTAEDEIVSLLKKGGPGGRGGAWVLASEVSVRFPTDEEVVPDVTGWRRERFADRFDENPIRPRPDWVCEILSDSTRLKDLGPKRRLYAQQGVPHLWLIDPNARVLEAFELVGSAWQLLGTWSESDTLSGLAPFPELKIKLADWWP
ncbi:MAG: Uma2 family endonuclease [Archangium sp.]|nr:Uma2 family endonuclease [Archangium sp.]